MSVPHGSSKQRRYVAFVVAIASIAAFVRAVFLSELMRSELGTINSLDSKFYKEVAASLVEGRGLPRGPLTFNPLYPYFLAGVYRIFGKSELAPRALQAALGIITIVLVYLSAKRMVEGPRKRKPDGEITAEAASLMALLYAPLLIYEGILLGATLEVFLLAAAFSISLSLDSSLGDRLAQVKGELSRKIALSCAFLGLCLGAGSLARPNLFLILAVSVPIWMVARSRRKRAGLFYAVIVIAFTVLAALPALVHNLETDRRFVPVTAHGGINFYIGNRGGSQGVFSPPDDMRADMRGLLIDARERAEAACGRAMSDVDVSNYYLELAFEEIGRDKARWLKLIGKKLLLFFNKEEVPDIPTAVFVRESSRIVKLLWFPYAAIAPLSVAGLVVLFRSKRKRSVVAIYFAACVLSVVSFYVNDRYRLPSVPIMLCLAAFFLSWSYREISRGRAKSLALPTVAILGVYFFATSKDMVAINRSAAYTALGNHYIELGEERKAMEAFAEAYRLDSGRIEAMINYARVLLKSGNASEAAKIYERAYSSNPRVPRLAIEYGSALEKSGRREEAKRLYERSLESPNRSERILACRLLAQAALAEGNAAEAADWIRRAIEISPQDSELAGMLKLLETAGQ